MATGFPTVTVTVVDLGLPDAIVGVPYSHFLEAMDGVPPFTWALIGGSLPTGITLTPATGEVSGTPTVVGTFSPEFEATDSGAKVGSRITPFRVAPDLGDVRNYQTEDNVRNGKAVVPSEGGTANELRRRLAKLLVRDATQVTQPYQLDARDLQVAAFLATPYQSVDDALRGLEALITGAAYGLDANGAGAPYVTPGSPDGELNIVGLGSISVAKNIPMNQLEISFVGAPLSSPFDVMPAPSGDATGVTDTAALNAFFAGAVQDWVVSPQDETDDPYYINADLNAPGGSQLWRMTGKSRRAFRIIGVGGIRTINQVVTVEHANLADVRCYGNTTVETVDYVDTRLTLSLAGALVRSGDRARMRNSAIELLAAGTMVTDGHRHFEADHSYFFTQIAAALTFITPDSTSGNASFTRIADSHFWTDDAGQTVIDLSGLDDDLKLVLLGSNHFSGPGTPISRPVVTTVPNYAESVQLVDKAGVIPIPTF